MAHRRKRNVTRHTTRQSMQLVDWFRSNRAEIEAKRLSSAEAAKMASKALRFHVTANNMTGVAGTGKKSILHFNWPKRTRGGPKPVVTQKDVTRLEKIAARLTKEIHTLRSRLGK